MFEKQGVCAAVVLATGVVGLAANAVLAQDAPPEDQTELKLEPKSWADGWKGTVELGVNGSSGNTENFNLRAGLSGTRVTEKYDTTASLVYAYATNDGTATESRFAFDLRNDWKFTDSPWRVFALGSAEFDDFQDWDWRLAAAAGVGYAFVDNEKTTLVGRLGGGLSKKIGGSDNAIRPEALIGVDYRQQLTERQQLTASATLYPDLSDIGEFRFVGNAAWEVLIDPEVNLSLKLGVEDRYDSMPGGGFKKNDIDYFAMLVFAF